MRGLRILRQMGLRRFLLADTTLIPLEQKRDGSIEIDMFLLRRRNNMGLAVRWRDQEDGREWFIIAPLSGRRPRDTEEAFRIHNEIKRRFLVPEEELDGFTPDTDPLPAAS